MLSVAKQHTGGEGLLFISSASCGGVKFKMDWTSGLQEENFRCKVLTRAIQQTNKEKCRNVKKLKNNL